MVLLNPLIRYTTRYNTKAIQLAHKLKTLDNIFNFTKYKIKYKRELLDIWKYPDETLADGYGDCEDKSILLKTMLDTIDIPSAFVIKYKPEKRIGHVYIIAKQNSHWITLDPSCYSCPKGHTFSKNWKTVAIVYDHKTLVYDPYLYQRLVYKTF